MGEKLKTQTRKKNEWAKSARTFGVTAIGGGGKTESKILTGKVVEEKRAGSIEGRGREDSSGTRREMRERRANASSDAR